jgi:peptide-methionine (R)-S-oxide reductase
MTDKVEKSKKEWMDTLTPEQYRVTRQKGTERPFTGKYHDCKKDGVYVCVCCAFTRRCTRTTSARRRIAHCG